MQEIKKNNRDNRNIYACQELLMITDIEDWDNCTSIVAGVAGIAGRVGRVGRVGRIIRSICWGGGMSCDVVFSLWHTRDGIFFLKGVWSKVKS